MNDLGRTHFRSCGPSALRRLPLLAAPDARPLSLAVKLTALAAAFAFGALLALRVLL